MRAYCRKLRRDLKFVYKEMDSNANVEYFFQTVLLFSLILHTRSSPLLTLSLVVGRAGAWHRMPVVNMSYACKGNIYI